MSNIVTLLSEFYPEINTIITNKKSPITKLNSPDIASFVKQKKINAINLVTGIGSPEINKKSPKITQKILLSLNDIYIRSNVEIDHFFTSLEIDEYFIDKLTRGILVPSRDFIDRLISKYRVNPTFLYDNSKNMYL